MKQLTETQCCQVAGGFGGLQDITSAAAIGSGLNVLTYGFTAEHPGAAASGLIMASGGGSLISIASLIHRPGMAALNWGIQQAAPGKY